MLVGNPMILRQLPLDMAMRKTAESGFDALEMWLPQLAEARTPELRRKVGEFAESLGTPLVRLNVADPDYLQELTGPQDVAKAVEGLKHDIDFAADLGMTEVLSWEGRRPKGATRDDLYGWVLDETVNIFQKAVDYGRTRGVKVLTEIHPFTLGIDTEWAVQLCDRIDDFGVVYDCSHFGVGLPDSYIEAIHTLGKRIRHIHFCDSDKKSSEVHFAVGTGCLDLDGIVDAFKEIGFDGTVMVDLWLYPLPEEGTKVGVPYCREVIEKLGL